MRENFVITRRCIRLFPPPPPHTTTTTLTPITEKEQERKTKQKKKGDEVHCGRKKREKFKAAMRKWQILAASNVKMSWSEKKKKERRNIYDFSSIKRTTRKFHVSWSRAKQWQTNIQKKNALHLQTFFSLLSPIDFLAFLVAVTG